MRRTWRRVGPALVIGLILALAGTTSAGVVAAEPVPAPAPALADTVVRVGIGRSQSSATLGATGGFSVVDAASGATLVSKSQAGEVTVQPDAGGLRLDTAVFVGPLRLKAAAGGFVTYGGHHYRGSLEVLKNSRGLLSVVNVVVMEEYLPGVVPKEMGTSYRPEALKAQAVAARTYALGQVGSNKYTGEGFDLSDDATSQAYGGVDAEVPGATSAVQATYHQVVVDAAGQPISTYYFSASGGMTESDEYVWGGSGHSYLRGVADYDQLSPYFRWQVTMGLDEAQAKLKAYGVDVGTLQSIQPYTPPGVPESSYRSPATGQYKEYVVAGSRGQSRITASNLRFGLSLRSRVFTITAQGGGPGGNPVKQPGDVVVVQGAGGTGSRVVGGSFGLGAGGRLVQLSQGAQVLGSTAPATPVTLVIDGKGNGHGVGLSQWGAQGMATIGSDYKAILTHFYTGTQVVQR